VCSSDLFLGPTIDEKIATALYCAIATDTGWFRFPSTNSDTMRIVGELIDFGALPHLIYSQLYEQRTVARTRLGGRVMNRVEQDCDGKLAYIQVTQNDFKETHAVPADTEDLVNECLKIAGTCGAFIAVEQQNRSIKVSFRGRNDINVAKVAEQFGGGGHKLAAGAVLPGPLPDALAKILVAMKIAIEN
jgi:phosphoesterase RecJ-like protein